MKRNLFLIPLFFVMSLHSQTIYHTQILHPTIKTLQIGLSGQNYSLPLIQLNSKDILEIQFDELSHNIHNYTYKVFHCNADWTLSNLSTNEYLEGFTTGNIYDYALSQNTTYQYTHYRFILPNDEMNFKISGNYMVMIYEENKIENPVAIACFSVVEPKVNIIAKLRANTDIELSGRFQQLDIEVGLNGYRLQDPQSEIKMVIRQNNRIDNQVTNILPTYLSTEKLSYINQKELIFEGGNEYRHFDMSSIYVVGEGLDTIRFNKTFYDVYLKEDVPSTSKNYLSQPDLNGKFIIHYQEAFDDINTEADYMQVHFSLYTGQPYFDGQVYIGGEYNYNLLNETSQMQYNFDEGRYNKIILLKQGGYNYQYWFLPKGGKKASVEKIEGSYWQTNNEYTIYVYHRPWGGRYDKLIGVKIID